MKTILTILAGLLLQFAAFGQATEAERLLIETIGTEKVSEKADLQFLKSRVQISQTGNSNYAAVTQMAVGTQPNAAFITQVGGVNSANLVQHGEGNKVMASQQGSNNTYNGYISGYNNSATIVQDGYGNSISQHVDGNSLDYSLLQLGNNNNITQIENSLNSTPYKVVQQGNNMNITIEQSNWGIPVTVTKK